MPGIKNGDTLHIKRCVCLRPVEGVWTCPWSTAALGRFLYSFPKVHSEYMTQPHTWSANTKNVWVNRFMDMNTSMWTGTTAIKNCTEANINHEERLRWQTMPCASILPLIPKANLPSKNGLPGSVFPIYQYLLLVHTEWAKKKGVQSRWESVCTLRNS